MHLLKSVAAFLFTFFLQMALRVLFVTQDVFPFLQNHTSLNFSLTFKKMLTSNHSDLTLKLIIVMSIVFKFGFKKNQLSFCLSWAPQLLLAAIYFWRSLKCQTVRRQSGGYFQKSHVWDASIVALVPWDLTLFLTAAQNTERQAINLWAKKKYRFRDTWKQPTGMDQMDFSSLCPFFFT